MRHRNPADRPVGNPRAPADIPVDRAAAEEDIRPAEVAADNHWAEAADSHPAEGPVGNHRAEVAAGSRRAEGSHQAEEEGDIHPLVPAAGSCRRAEGEVVDWSSNLPNLKVSSQRETAIVEMILSTSVWRFTSHSGNRTAMSQMIPQETPANTR